MSKTHVGATIIELTPDKQSGRHPSPTLRLLRVKVRQAEHYLQNPHRRKKARPRRPGSEMGSVYIRLLRQHDIEERRVDGLGTAIEGSKLTVFDDVELLVALFAAHNLAILTHIACVEQL